MRHVVHERNEAIATFRYGLEVTRVLGVVLQSRPYLPDGKVQSVLKVDVGIRTPHLLRQLIPRNDLAGSVDKDGEDFGGLRLKLKHRSGSSKLSRAKVKLEFAK